MVRIIAIDGRCAAGKTTLAARLVKELGGDVIHMDDFFLPPALRTPERRSEPGGNVHYERFLTEVLPNLRSGRPFSYRRFDCSRMTLGEEIPVKIRLIDCVGFMVPEATGDMERYRDATLVQQLHERHQRGDELLAGGDRKPLRVSSASDGPFKRAFRDRKTDRRRILSYEGLGDASQYGPLAFQ